MLSYRIQLREVRLATDGTDDVALFDVTRETDDETWVVPALLSPLFRVIHAETAMSPDNRREMVVGLGARAIREHLVQHGGLPEEPLLFGLDYPGAPGEPEPLLPYEDATLEVEEDSVRNVQQVD